MGPEFPTFCESDFFLLYVAAEERVVAVLLEMQRPEREEPFGPLYYESCPDLVNELEADDTAVFRPAIGDGGVVVAEQGQRFRLIQEHTATDTGVEIR